MAKYTILMSCGHEEIMELFGKEKDRQNKIEYFGRCGLCKECYKKEMENQAQKMGLVFNASVSPYIDENTGNILINLWFTGNTKPYKDQIKSIGGYKWERFGESLLCSDPIWCWNKVVDLNELPEEAEKAEAIGANKIDIKDSILTGTNYQIALERQNQWKEKNKKLSLIQKPCVPEVLKNHKWNQKIYGKSGNYTIYPDGEKISITDEQAQEIKDYLIKKEEYRKKVEEIKNGKI